MDSISGYKNRALASLEGKWSNGIIATLIVALISGGVSQVITLPMGEVTGASINGLWSLLCLPLSWGATVYFLNLIRNQNISYERLFDGYKDFVRIFLAGFLVNLCILIGFVLLIVPGIIIALGLSQTSYILKDDPQISCSDAMKQSWQMMKGHKMDLFLLILSFIGWAILAIFTFFIGFLFLAPYVSSAEAHFYEDLKEEQNYA